MAKPDKKEKQTEEVIDGLRDKSSLTVYGMDSSLDRENLEIRSIIQSTISDTKVKYSERTNGKPINYFNEIGFGQAFSDIIGSAKSKETGANTPADLKRIMSENSNIDVSGLMLEDATRTVCFNNYRIIDKHIPECAMAKNIYKDNIMSPDDYTKLIFNVKYEKAVDATSRELVESRLDKLNEKYELEVKADQIIDEALTLGEAYVAVLSIEDEINYMMSDSVMGGSVLNESLIRGSDTDVTDIQILSENIEIDKDTEDALLEYYDMGSNTGLSKAELKKLKEDIAQIVNTNVLIGSKRELLTEKVQAEYDKKKNEPLVDIITPRTEKTKKKKTGDTRPLYLNGSSIRRLNPDKVVELKIDNICYGYYYIEEISNGIPQTSYLGVNSGRSVTGQSSLAQNNTVTSTSAASYSPMTGAAAQLGVGEQKLRLISNLFLNCISKKLDKEFIRKNKQFKDFIYDLVRQQYIIKKGVKLTYFKPDEVIKFECDAVYKDITFFAKLYLAILTNNLIIKLGRAHDKRVFYVNVGADAAYEQAIQSVIEDIKTKDYKMDSLNDFNTILRLNPGRFDDYYMPTINGERPVEIDTLAGMDVDMNNEFVDYLKNSMMSGMGVPRNLIDVTSEIDFARSVSAMNANFVRSVIRYQKRLTPSFTRMYQILYKNEYRFLDNAENKEENSTTDINSIRVSFPSPATLAMTNVSEQIQSADSNADFIASQILPPRADGSTEDIRVALKSEIVKDLLPGIDWEKYEKLLSEVKLNLAKEQTEAKANPVPEQDPYAGY